MAFMKHYSQTEAMLFGSKSEAAFLQSRFGVIVTRG